jgi:hypothetical protein
LQSTESRVVHISWGEFRNLALERVGRDQHQVLLRQLFHIRQISSVVAYAEQFSQLIDNLNAYQSMPDLLFYTLKFVDGLRDDIKVVVMLQRPQDLDTAVVLAQLQEEANTMLKKRDYRWSDASTITRPTRHPMVQQQNTKNVRQLSLGKPEDKTMGNKSSSTKDRIASLYAYRKAKGLCYKCGLQYSIDHKCAETVQLHVVEELWQMAQVTEEESDPCSTMEEDEPELNMVRVSQEAMEGTEAPRTMKFVDYIDGIDILALLDSGSSHSFISADVAARVSVATMDKPLQVQVANGSHLSYNQ